MNEIIQKFMKKVDCIKTVDTEAEKKAELRLNTRMKPVGSLGYLEEIVKIISRIKGNEFYEINRALHIVASSDNGVVEEGVSSCPVEYTRIVSEAMLQEKAAIGIICNTLGVDFKLIDVGMVEKIRREYPNLYNYTVERGSKNFYKEPSLGVENTVKAMEIGMDFIKNNGKDYDIFSNGEMGIGNTTTSSAILYSLVKNSNIDEIVGRGGGLSDEGFEIKKKIIKESCEKYNTFSMSPVEIVATVGGYDIACMVGLYIGAALEKKPMLIDGFISSVAALVAVRINPKIKDYLICTHMSQEPGMKIVMRELGMSPPLNMGMRLGEGTGAVLAYPIIKSATNIMKKMMTPEEVYKLNF